MYFWWEITQQVYKSLPRIVSDVKWSSFYEHIFATSSNDGMIVVSDLRFNKSPIFVRLCLI